MKSYRDLLADTKKDIREVTPEDVKRALDERRSVRLIDVREADEWEAGHLPGANHIPRGFLESKIENAVPDRNSEVILYCAAGNRSAFGAKTLRDLGYANVSSMSGGFGRWHDKSYP